jgi:FKBP-type peptidyl-prolyl cis-trans isomerase 2
MTNQPTQEDYAITTSGCYVKIGYQVRIVNGRVLKGAAEPEIMDFVTGYMQVIPGLESRLVGHRQGERLSFNVPCEEAFGERRPELVFEKSKDEFHFPPPYEPYPGMEISLVCSNENAPDTLIIREVKEDTIVVDLNHPLSGAAFAYNLEILETRPAKPEEVCGEWEGQKVEQACCHQAPEIILGAEDPEEK